MQRAASKGKRVVITTLGSTGDLHPYVAVALGLRARGDDVVIATGECYRAKIEKLGLGFAPVRPDCDWVADPQVMRRILQPQRGLERIMREVLLPVLWQTYEDTSAAAQGADLLVAMQSNLASPLVAEKQGIPWVSAMHLPIGLASAYDPPVLPGFEVLSKALRFLGPAFWVPLRRSLTWATNFWAKPWYRLREEIGLPPGATANPLTQGQAPLLHLALFSPLIIDKQADWPPQTVVTGFPWYDRHGEGELPAELARFLDAGSPPVVFTLGTAIVEGAGAAEFFATSAAAAKSLGRRAVLIFNGPRNRLPALPEGVLVVDYAPFSELLPRAAAVVHHGGIGTTGLAMRSGRPMLVMPCAWDQPDNAARAVRLGVARTISRRRYTAARVAAELGRLLDNPRYAERASKVGEQVRQEDGARVACDALSGLLDRRPAGDTLLERHRICGRSDSE
ncbi:MAG TPA: glycosyltransferase [Planctomycetaceae bacterium]|jgi:UDP:flavonoid glycosyltransferase YjiC (YdhE family)